MLLGAGGQALLDAHVTIPPAAGGSTGSSRLHRDWNLVLGPTAGPRGAADQSSSVRALDIIDLGEAANRMPQELLLSSGIAVAVLNEVHPYNPDRI